MRLKETRRLQIEAWVLGGLMFVAAARAVASLFA
jgi:hypothetical protein